MLVPEEMDESYDDYLALQREQGFDLSKYAGKRVKRYTYEVLNYPTGETGVQVNLVIYNNVVIGGEVLSPHLDGFLHGLSLPGQKAPSVASATDSGFPVLPVIICIVAMGAIVAVLVLKKKKPAVEAVHVPPAQTEPSKPATPPERPQTAPAAKETPPASGPKFCPNCGKPLTPGAKFCPDCGAAQAAAPKMNSAPARPAAPTVTLNSRTLLIVAGAVILVLLAVLIFRSGQSKAPASDPAQTSQAEQDPASALVGTWTNKDGVGLKFTKDGKLKLTGNGVSWGVDGDTFTYEADGNGNLTLTTSAAGIIVDVDTPYAIIGNTLYIELGGEALELTKK